MGKFVKKAVSETASTSTAENPKSPKGFVDGTRYSRAAENIQPVIDQLDTLKKSLLINASDVTSIEEDRRREGETYAFDLKLKRSKELATFAAEDAERLAEIAEKDAAVTAAEDELLSLLSLTRNADGNVPPPKMIRTAFEARIKAVDTAAEGRGKGMAKAEYETTKKVDDAQAATKLALLEQKNAQLEAANTALAAQNKSLLEAQAKTNDTVAEVAKQGLAAAAGVVKQGNDALGSAANAGAGRIGR